MRILLALALGLPLAFGVSAQEVDRQAPLPVFTGASADLVVLPVTVIHKDGEFITGLPQEHFHVFDNGRPQEIAMFSTEDTPVTIGLVVDASGSMRPKMGEVIAATLALVRSSNPDDEIFVVGFNDTVHDNVGGGGWVPAGDLP